jgi:hypothetical protein
MEQLTKKCWRCPPEKGDQSIESFCRKGKDSVCKKCRYELNAEWAKDNRDKLRPKRATYMKEYRAKKKVEMEALKAAVKTSLTDPQKE